jgi:hypothetical protein
VPEDPSETALRAAGWAARTMRAYRGRVGGGYRVRPRTSVSGPTPSKKSECECQFQRRALDSASVTARPTALLARPPLAVHQDPALLATNARSAGWVSPGTRVALTVSE